jgi:hypothetical protein
MFLPYSHQSHRKWTRFMGSYGYRSNIGKIYGIESDLKIWVAVLMDICKWGSLQSGTLLSLPEYMQTRRSFGVCSRPSLFYIPSSCALQAHTGESTNLGPMKGGQSTVNARFVDYAVGWLSLSATKEKSGALDGCGDGPKLGA